MIRLRTLLDRELVLDPRVRALGLIALACWSFHYVRYVWVLDQGASMWWLCHVTTLLLGVGLIASVASAVRVAAVLSIVGFPVWIIDVVSTGVTNRVSVLSHIVVPIVAGLALSQVRVRGPVIWLSFGFYVVVQWLSRWMTPPHMNINLAHRSYEFLAGTVVETYPVYWTVTSLLFLGTISLVTWSARRYFPADPVFVELAPVEPLIVEAKEPEPTFENAEPGFRLAPKVARVQEPAVAAAPPPAAKPKTQDPRVAPPRFAPPPPTPAPAPPKAAPRARTGLVVERTKAPQVPPRGFSLLEMMTVVAILGILTAIAMPDLTPAIHRARVRSTGEEVASFVERARRAARAEGRCYRVRPVGSPVTQLLMERRKSPDCYTTPGGTLSPNAAGIDWEVVLSYKTPARTTLVVESTPLISGAQADIVFRPNGRLRGDGDLDITEESARITIDYAPIKNYYAVNVITSQGRQCPRMLPAIPAPLSGTAAVCGLGFTSSGFGSGGGGGGGGGGGFY